MEKIYIISHFKFHNSNLLMYINIGNKEFLVQDPDGYLLRFSEDLGEKEV